MGRPCFGQGVAGRSHGCPPDGRPCAAYSLLCPRRLPAGHVLTRPTKLAPRLAGRSRDAPGSRPASRWGGEVPGGHAGRVSGAAARGAPSALCRRAPRSGGIAERWTGFRADLRSPSLVFLSFWCTCRLGGPTRWLWWARRGWTDSRARYWWIHSRFPPRTTRDDPVELPRRGCIRVFAPLRPPCPRRPSSLGGKKPPPASSPDRVMVTSSSA